MTSTPRSLLAALQAIQESEGAVSDSALTELARQSGTPLHRLEGLRSFYPQFHRHPTETPHRLVCRDMACRMAAGGDPIAQLAQDAAAAGGSATTATSCLGRCDHAPAVLVGDVPHRIVRGAGAEAPRLVAIPASAPRRWAIDPYGPGQPRYQALDECRTPADADALIATLKAADLRGMGGAGFPTGRKWEACRRAEHPVRAVVCNADESEPGTFKDRVILAELPHLVIEGMALAGRVTGATEGIIYLRHEYAVERAILDNALADARRVGALGEATGFDIRIFVSPGGYILGEETALLEALEDRRGEPRNKPPYPVSSGLHGEPTLINNVETLACCASIALHGADWWRKQGKGDSSGLKFLAVSGDVARPDVYCVPLGTTAAEVLALAGGMRHGAPPLAYFPGGASTNPLPADRLDTPMDWESLRDAGSALGSGALTIIAEGRDLLDLVLAQVRFFRNESCGKCVPCRLGSQKTVELVEEALAGRAAPDLPARIRQLNGTLARTSICGLGQVALAPLVALMDHFPQRHWQALAAKSTRP